MIIEKNLLPHKFYTHPETAKTIKSEIGLRCVLTQTGGYIFAKGRAWKILSDYIGDNEHIVYLSDFRGASPA